MSLPHDTITPELSEAVLTAMREAAEAEIMPRWRSLSDDEVRTKSSEWDLVTDADEQAEIRLTAALKELVDIPVVGEEATAQDASLLDLVDGEGAVWVVDPVDGTRNFVEGSEAFGCMVALIDDGRTVASWITYPAVGREIHAAKGVGTFLDGERLLAPTPADAGALRGALGAKFFSGDGQALMDRASTLGPAQPIRFCAAWDYLDVVTGVTDYVSFTRTLPWDHAPGALICQEAGLMSARPTGDEYLPGGDVHGGILTAHPSVWQRVAGVIAQL
ncbi:inositol monophosphatase family protein [Demequina sp. NBRC 110052]|uniref:inositol monophosphatase family protein n=1 Tax=Demequina sp. NBRC 110052 TaxID=1570341 RepID=UPI0009FEBDD6|nr:inositol monophosphatase family protein [Demequina sp. NBRC 110052]